LNIKRKSWLVRLFCKHEYHPYKKNSTFQHLRGERVYYFCKKCGKEGHSAFREFEGNGFK
jgi:hypothetical protein